MQGNTVITNKIPEDFVLSGSHTKEHPTVIIALSHRLGLAPFDLLYFDTKCYCERCDKKAAVYDACKRVSNWFPVLQSHVYCNESYDRNLLEHGVEWFHGSGIVELVENDQGILLLADA